MLGRQGSNLLQFLLGKDLANGVMRGIENNDLGTRRNLGFEFLDINLPFTRAHILGDVALRTDRAVHGHTPVHGDVGLAKGSITKKKRVSLGSNDGKATAPRVSVIVIDVLPSLF